MIGKTFNQVEIKPEMILCHLLLHYLQNRQGQSYILRHQGLILIKAAYPYCCKQQSIA